MDFTTIFDISGFQVFILVMIDLTTREVVSIGATYNPDRNWIIQMLRNAAIDGFELPSKMIIDNDGIYGGWVEKVFKEFEIDILRIPKGAPWCNGVVERFHLSLKKEIFSRISLKDDLHAISLCNHYQKYFNTGRPHQSIEGKTPSFDGKLVSIRAQTQKFRYVKVPEVFGLVTRFALAA